MFLNIFHLLFLSHFATEDQASSGQIVGWGARWICLLGRFFPLWEQEAEAHWGKGCGSRQGKGVRRWNCSAHGSQRRRHCIVFEGIIYALHYDIRQAVWLMPDIGLWYGTQVRGEDLPYAEGRWVSLFPETCNGLILIKRSGSWLLFNLGFSWPCI